MPKTMMSERRVIVVVPALDEAPRIGRVIDSMPDFVDAILVVDDGSTDGTGETARRRGDPRVEVLSHAVRQGVGAAILSGYRRAIELSSHPNDVFAVMAGDGQMDAHDLPRVVEPVVRGLSGYVKGNRFSHPEKKAMPRLRYFGGRVLSVLTSLATGRKIEDSQCGFTAISRRAALAIDFERVWKGYGYPNDLFARLVEAGVTTEEVTVRPVYADEVSKLRPRHLLGIARVVAHAGVRRMRRSEVAHPQIR